MKITSQDAGNTANTVANTLLFSTAKLKTLHKKRKLYCDNSQYTAQ